MKTAHNIRVLMLGWEFPPFISGGLGTACHGLASALVHHGAAVTFLLPRSLRGASVNLSPSVPQPGQMSVRPVPSAVRSPYPGHWEEPEPEPADLTPLTLAGGLRVVGAGGGGGYGGDLLARTRAYAQRCLDVAGDEPFDVIHAHDWMTFAAGQALARRFDKPLVVHVHATEFDRSGEHVNQSVYELERSGVHAATRVVAVSGLTRDVLVRRYGIAGSKVQVVHNGMQAADATHPLGPLGDHRRTVLFMGRLTRQKGPTYLLEAARSVVRSMPDARFVIAGKGEMLPMLVERAARYGLSSNVFFSGFLQGKQVDQAYRQSDVYVMPSVSEPFGLTALEALRFGTPAIISRTSGVSEVLSAGALKTDYWDVQRMATQILSVLRHAPLADHLRRAGQRELQRLSWHRAARGCMSLYRQIVA